MKINKSINSMQLTKHLRIVLESSYSSNQIAKYCNLDVRFICALRNGSMKLSHLSLGNCWKINRFYYHHYLYGMNRSQATPYIWKHILSKHILWLLHKVCLCAWSMKPNATIWSDFKKLAHSYGRFYNYGMHNHPKIATVGYVRHILHLPYHYALKKPFRLKITIPFSVGSNKKKIITSWAIPDYRRSQPEVTQLSANQFSIITPYEDGFTSHIHFELAFKHDSWYLLTDVNPKVKRLERNEKHHLSTVKYQQLLRTVYDMCIKYQINRSANDIYFIEISDYSLQSAYYRLVHFELVRLALIRFLNKIGG